MTEKPDLPKRLSTDDRRRDLPRHVELWSLLLDEKNKGKGCAKPRDGYPRQDGRHGISLYPKKLEAEEKERRFDEKERRLLPRKLEADEKERRKERRRFDEKERRLLPRKLQADEKERRLDEKYRQQGYYDDHDQRPRALRSKAASRPRQAHRQWAMKFGEAEPRYAPPKRC